MDGAQRSDDEVHPITTHSTEDSLYRESSIESSLQLLDHESNDVLRESMTPPLVPVTNHADITTYPVRLSPNLWLPNCIMNASGLMGNPRDIERLDRQQATGAIVTKSSTFHKKEGRLIFLHSAPVKGQPPPTMNLQGKGTPNYGLENYLAMGFARRRSGKTSPYILSLQGATLEDVIGQLKAAIKFNLLKKCQQFIVPVISAVEINMAIKLDGSKHKLGYAMDGIQGLINALQEIPHIGEFPVGLKLPPYFEACVIKDVADIILAANRKIPNTIDYVASVYSVANSLVLDVLKDTEVMPVNNGYGGLCGGSIRPIGLGNVRRLREYLGENLGIIGVGGICSSHDVYEYLLAGADAVQVGSMLHYKGPEIITRFTQGLDRMMKMKGIEDPSLVRTRLKSHDEYQQ